MFNYSRTKYLEKATWFVRKNSLQQILKLHYIYPFLHVRDHLLSADDGKIRPLFIHLTTGCTFTL